MKPQIETLIQKFKGTKLNVYQEAEALIEFNKLLDYIETLEKKLDDA